MHQADRGHSTADRCEAADYFINKIGAGAPAANDGGTIVAELIDCSTELCEVIYNIETVTAEIEDIVLGVAGAPAALSKAAVDDRMRRIHRLLMLMYNQHQQAERLAGGVNAGMMRRAA